MTWLKLNIDRVDALHSQLVRDRFDVSGAIASYRIPGVSEAPTRQLEWYRREVQPKAWIDTQTGNMILIEAIGSEQWQRGRVSACLWIAASDTYLPLVSPVRFLEDQDGVPNIAVAFARISASLESLDVVGLPEGM